MKKKIVCWLGIHRPQPTIDEVELYRINNHYFDVVEKCAYCGKYVKVGSIETPPPQYMANWNFKIIND